MWEEGASCRSRSRLESVESEGNFSQVTSRARRPCLSFSPPAPHPRTPTHESDSSETFVPEPWEDHRLWARGFTEGSPGLTDCSHGHRWPLALIRNTLALWCGTRAWCTVFSLPGKDLEDQPQRVQFTSSINPRHQGNKSRSQLFLCSEEKQGLEGTQSVVSQPRGSQWESSWEEQAIQQDPGEGITINVWLNILTAMLGSSCLHWSSSMRCVTQETLTSEATWFFFSGNEQPK